MSSELLYLVKIKRLPCPVLMNSILQCSSRQVDGSVRLKFDSTLQFSMK